MSVKKGCLISAVLEISRNTHESLSDVMIEGFVKTFHHFVRYGYTMKWCTETVKRWMFKEPRERDICREVMVVIDQNMRFDTKIVKSVAKREIDIDVRVVRRTHFNLGQQLIGMHIINNLVKYIHKRRLGAQKRPNMLILKNLRKKIKKDRVETKESNDLIRFTKGQTIFTRARNKKACCLLIFVVFVEA